jgi:hypothetical protein
MPTAMQLSKQGSVAESTSPAATSSTDSRSMMQRPCKSHSRGSQGHDPMSTVLVPRLCCGWPHSSCVVHARSSCSTRSGSSATTLTRTAHWPPASHTEHASRSRGACYDHAHSNPFPAVYGPVPIAACLTALTSILIFRTRLVLPARIRSNTLLRPASSVDAHPLGFSQ